MATSQLHAHPPACPGFSTNTEWGQRAAEPSSEQRPALHTTCAEALRVAQKDTGQSSGRAPSSGDVQSKLKPQGCECRRSPWSRPGGDSPVPRGQGLPFLPLPIPALPGLSPSAEMPFCGSRHTPLSQRRLHSVMLVPQETGGFGTGCCPEPPVGLTERSYQRE